MARSGEGRPSFGPPGLVMAALARGFLRRRRRREEGERSRGETPVAIAYLHRVSNRGLDHPETLPAPAFRSLLVELGKRGYRFVSLEELDAILARGKNADRVVALTFDDCYGCNFDHACPVLAELGIPATFFIATSFIDSPRPFLESDAASIAGEVPNFTGDQLRSLAKNPLFELASHTVSHPDLARVASREEIVRELRDSRLTLESLAGRPVTRFSAPYGGMPQCHETVISVAREVGYTRIYSAFGGRNLVDRDGRVGYVLQRAWVKFDSVPFLEAALEGNVGRYSWIPGSGRPRQAPGFHPFSVQC